MKKISKQVQNYYNQALLDMAKSKLVYEDFANLYGVSKLSWIDRVRNQIGYWRYKIGSWIAGGFDEDY